MPTSRAMLLLRSLLFNVVFYVSMILWMIALLPTFILPRRLFLRGPQTWARFNFLLLKWIVGTKVEVRGRENVPEGGLLVASKHQSLFEAFALITVFDDPAYVLKRELTWIPVFGWYLWKGEQVPINRGGRAAALSALSARARRETERGRQIIIFPEGTRRPPGALPAYKHGVAHLYESVDVPCVPVALNSGLYWPRRSFLRRPGTIVVEILPPLPRHLPRGEMVPALVERLEGAANRLHAEGLAELGMVNAPPAARPELGQI